MAGTFSKALRPKRPGAYFNFVAQVADPVLSPTTGVVVVPFTHDWGPGEQIVPVNSLGEFLAIFGRGPTAGVGQYTAGYKAVAQAFQGEGLPGRGGAAQVLCFRMEGTTAAKATKALSNGAVNALTLQARYTGSFGNLLTVKVEADAKAPGTQDNLVILANGVEVERWVYNRTDITGLAAQINAPVTGSDYVVTTGAVTSGVALTAIATPSALTAGNDGSALLAADWTALMSSAEAWRFSLLAAYGLTDSTIQASLLSWSQTLNAKGKRFMTVVGGASGETSATAVTRSAALNDPNFVNVGVGSYNDDTFGPLSTSELTSRVAGILARNGESESLTFKRLAGVEIVTGPTDSQITDCLAGGVVVLSRDSHPTAPTRLEKGLTTFTTANDPNRPLSIYSVPSFIRIMGGIETELTEWAEINVIGRMVVNDGTRQYVRAQMESRIAAREAAGIIQKGFTVVVDPDPAPTDTDDFVALRYQFTFARTLEQVLNTVVVG